MARQAKHKHDSLETLTEQVSHMSHVLVTSESYESCTGHKWVIWVMFQSSMVSCLYHWVMSCLVCFLRFILCFHMWCSCGLLRCCASTVVSWWMSLFSLCLLFDVVCCVKLQDPVQELETARREEAERLKRLVGEDGREGGSEREREREREWELVDCSWSSWSWIHVKSSVWYSPGLDWFFTHTHWAQSAPSPPCFSRLFSFYFVPTRQRLWSIF